LPSSGLGREGEQTGNTQRRGYSLFEDEPTATGASRA
jgi:hypothetical protein